jgi:hypothetical protein
LSEQASLSYRDDFPLARVGLAEKPAEKGSIIIFIGIKFSTDLHLCAWANRVKE